MIMEDYVIDNIIEVFKNNLNLMFINDEYLKKIKAYCREIADDEIKRDIARLSIHHDLLQEFVYEALNDLLTCEYLYDFRDLE